MTLSRSWLFVPGIDKRKLERAKKSKSDILIYDLEDAVSFDEKELARNMVKEELLTNKELIIYVRVNATSTSFFLDDICQIVTHKGLHGILLPKSENKEELIYTDYLLTRLENHHGLTLGSIEIVPLIETALGLYNGFEIATSCKRVRRMAFGSVDYALDINADLTNSEKVLLYARSKLVVLSRAAGLEPPIDTVYLDINNDSGLLSEAKFIKELGFRSKLVIHPNQIDIVNNVFSPTSQEIKDAQKIIMVYEKALSNGIAAIQLDGKMVDYPVFEKAKKLIEQCRTLEIDM